MKKMKYEIYQSTADSGEVITITKEIPWNEANEEIAKQEAYGEITVEDDGEGEIQPTPTLETRVATLEESNAEMIETLDMILSGVTEDE